MPYLQLRITLDPSGNRNRENVKQLLRSFRNKWLRLQDNVAHTCGYELLNKFGEPCDPHFHLNAYFDPPDLKDPLRSARNWIRREASAYDFNLKGNKQWSCTMVEEPKDYERWIRYPLKETGVFDLCSSAWRLSQDPSGNKSKELTVTYQQMVRDARNERKRSIEINILKRDKAIDKQSFKDKLFKHLDGLHTALWKDDPSNCPPPDHKIIWINILAYYREQGKSVCFKTISGYTTLYQLHIGTITPEECYQLR